jgi:hypothetical protein
MTHLKNYFRQYTAASIITIGLLLALVFAFKPVSDVKQIMTIEVIESGRGKGLYVYVDGEHIDFVEVPAIGYAKTDVVANGTILNHTLNKYYKENWRLVGSSNGSFILNTIHSGTRVYLER